VYVGHLNLEATANAGLDILRESFKE
jgi:hypothetical protein